MANKLVLLSDVHLRWENPQARLDDLPKTQFTKLDFVYGWAKKNNAIVCQAGDMVDKPRSWYLLPLVTKFFMDWQNRGVETYMVRGQHDYYYYSEASQPATVIGALLTAGFLHLVDGPDPTTLDLDGTTVNLYGCSFGQSVPTPKKYSSENILLVHREISDTSLYNGHKFLSHKGFLKRHKNYKLILAADIHRKFKACLLSQVKKVERRIVNTGPMVRASATTYNFEHKPGFYVWTPKTQTLNWKSIPCAPAEDVLSRAHIAKQEEDDRRMAQFIVKLKKRSHSEYDEEDTTVSTFRSGMDEYIEEHRVGKDITEAIYNALQAVDLDEL